MTIRITYRTPKIDEPEDGEGKFPQENFPELAIDGSVALRSTPIG